MQWRIYGRPEGAQALLIKPVPPMLTIVTAAPSLCLVTFYSHNVDVHIVLNSDLLLAICTD